MKNFLNNKIYLLIGFFIVIYTIYIRLVLKRLPRELHMFDPINYVLIIITISWICLSLFIIWKNIRIILNIKSPSMNTFQKTLSSIQNIITESLQQVYFFLGQFVSNGYENISFLAEKFYEFFYTRTEALFLSISYAIRLIIVIIFLIDVFVFFKLYFFYRALILLCIPICINIFFFILKNFSSNLNEIQSYLILEEDGYDELTKEPLTIFKPSPGNEDIDLSYHVTQFIICSKITGYLQVYEYLHNYYSPRINIFIYSLYLIGWIYILIKNYIIV